MKKVIVSACLAGIKCRHDGQHRAKQEWVDAVKEGLAIPVCPEVLGGGKVPRNSCEICGDRVIDIQGNDVTDRLQKGAQKTLEIAQNNAIQCAFLKSKSPSCGSGEIFDGSFTGKKIAGDGIATRLLKKSGIRVISVD